MAEEEGQALFIHHWQYKEFCPPLLHAVGFLLVRQAFSESAPDHFPGRNVPVAKIV